MSLQMFGKSKQFFLFTGGEGESGHVGEWGVRAELFNVNSNFTVRRDRQKKQGARMGQVEVQPVIAVPAAGKTRFPLFTRGKVKLLRLHPKIFS